MTRASEILRNKTRQTFRLSAFTIKQCRRACGEKPCNPFGLVKKFEAPGSSGHFAHWADSFLCCPSELGKQAATRHQHSGSEGMAEPERPQLSPYQVELEAGKRYAWCRCGRSQKQPFCDGSHAGTDIEPLMFTAERTETALTLRLQGYRGPAFLRRVPSSAVADFLSRAMPMLPGVRFPFFLAMKRCPLTPMSAAGPVR